MNCAEVSEDTDPTPIEPETTQQPNNEPEVEPSEVISKESLNYMMKS